MIKLGKITLYNFGIFKGKVELDFSEKDIVGILAEYYTDKKRSNRSGKTLILEAIRYLLTGQSRARKEVDMIHNGEDMMWVQGEFVDPDGKSRVIKRGRDKNNKGILNLDWVEKTTESQEAIDNLFGVSKADFDLTCFFKQADINGFMDLSPTEKTKFLMKWLDNEHWKEKESKVKEDIKVLKNRLKDNETTIKALDSSVEVVEELESQIQALNKEREIVNANLHKYAQSEKKIYKALDKVEREKKDALKGIEQLQKNVEAAQERESEIEKLNLRIKKLRKSIKEDLAFYEENYSTDSIGAEGIDALKISISEYNSKLGIMQNGEGGVCPILNEGCDRIKFSKDDVVDVKEKLKELKETLQTERSKLKLIEEAEEAYERARGVTKERLSDARTRLSELEGGQSTEEALKELKQAEKASKFDDSDLKAKAERIDAKLEEADAEANRLERNIGGLETRIENANDALVKINELSERNEKLKKRLGDLNYLGLMFGKNGIPADEIENAFQEVQDDINLILKALECGLTVSFSPDKELNQWEDVCHCGFRYPKGYRKSECEECGSPRQKKRRDEISLKILEGDKEADFGMDSGGGKTIISYAVRIALTMLKRRQNKSKLNILFLDEVDSALDSHLAASITDSITKVLTKKLGYDQILMVSHKEEIKNSVPHILKVTRYDTYSDAEFA